MEGAPSNLRARTIESVAARGVPHADPGASHSRISLPSSARPASFSLSRESPGPSHASPQRGRRGRRAARGPCSRSAQAGRPLLLLLLLLLRHDLKNQVRSRDERPFDRDGRASRPLSPLAIMVISLKCTRNLKSLHRRNALFRSRNDSEPHSAFTGGRSSRLRLWLHRTRPKPAIFLYKIQE